MSESLGKYLVIEGIDGSGKTTRRDDLLARLSLPGGVPAIGVHEPGGTDIGEKLRRIILDPNIKLSPQTELDLFSAASRELVDQVIEPAISSGISVIADRYWWGRVAYQGFGSGLDVEDIVKQAELTLGNYYQPDAAVILDVPVKASRERKLAQGGGTDWFEQRDNSFFERVREGYLWLANKFDIEVIDATRSHQVVSEDVFNILGSTALSGD